MRRSDKQIHSRAEIDTIIRACQVCRLALAVKDDPYLVPISFGYDGQAFYFHTARNGKKIEFMEANNRVCFEFDRDVKLQRYQEDPCKWTFAYESVIGYGTTSEIFTEEEKKAAMNQIMLQYSGSEWSFDPDDLERTRLWRIDIESLTGKRSSDKSG